MLWRRLNNSVGPSRPPETAGLRACARSVTLPDVAQTFRFARAPIRFARLIAPPAILLAIVVISAERGEAHKPITSPYTYNDEVFPILRDRCGRCHVTGGVAPMSLMTYKDAFPWGESIRTELVAGHMPPWNVDDAAGRFRNAQALSARELNVLLTWVTGGNPMGSAERTPPPVEPQRGWRLGPPDLVVQMPSEFTIAADANEATQEFALPISTAEARLVRAVDLLPGNPAIVRSATVRVKESPAAATAEGVLAMWVPGDAPVPLADGTAFRLPPGADLVLRVHYKKTWQYERSAMTDRTSVGLYFAKAPATEVRALTLAPEGGATESLDPGLSFSRTVGEDVQAVAIYPDAALENVNVEVRAVRPDGSRAELIRVRPQADWARRYWFAQPVALPRGTQIGVVVTNRDILLPPGAAPVVARRPNISSLRLTLNVVPAR
jgi:hypothetical protein